jgi:hypothetical protein
MSKGKTFYAPNDQCARFSTWPGNKDNKTQSYCANSNIWCKGGTVETKAGEYNCVVHNDDYDVMEKDSGLQVTVYEGNNFEGQNWVMMASNNKQDFGSWWSSNISSIKVQKDCNDKKWIWDEDCQNSRQNTINGNSNDMYNNTKNFCNESYDNAFSKNCDTWCTNRSTDCTLRERHLKCESLEIPINECTSNNTPEVFIKKCENILSSGSPYKCSVSGLAQLQKDCKDLKLPDATCNSNAVYQEKEKIRKAKEFDESEAAKAKIAKENQEKEDIRNYENQKKEDKRNEELADQVAKNAEILRKQQELEAEKNRNQVNQLLGITTPPPKNDDTIMYIIISIVMCILVMSSSSSLGLIVIQD